MRMNRCPAPSRLAALYLTAILALTLFPSHASPELCFSDEFTGKVLDADDWVIEKRAAAALKNGEKGLAQSYSPDAISLSKGILHLTASRAASAHDQPANLVSARIQTKRTFLYGRFSFRVRLPKGKGLWSGIGLKGATPQTSADEIDVLQGFGAFPNIVESALQFSASSKEMRKYSAFLVVRPQPDDPVFHREGYQRIDKLITLQRDLSADYHVYTLQWESSGITWFLDGQPYYSLKDRVPKEPMTLIIRLGFGGISEARPDATTVLPQALDIDYVRIWSEGFQPVSSEESPSPQGG